MHFNDIEINKKRDKIIVLLIFAIFALVILGISIIFTMVKTQIKISEKMVQEVSEQLSFNVYNRLIGDFQALEMLSGSIETFEKFKPNDLELFINSYGKKSIFQDFSLIKPDGTTYTTTRYSSTIKKKYSEKTFCIKKSLYGVKCFERTKENLNSYKNIYTVPIHTGKKISAVVAGTARADIFKNILDINSFGGKGFGHIIKSDGTYVLNSRNSVSENNFFNQLSRLSSSDKNKIKNDFKNRTSGLFWTISNKEIWLCSYSPVAFDNWVIVLFVPASVLIVRTIEIMLLTIGIMLSINGILFFILKRFDTIQKRNYEKITNLAFVDNVTGGMNKNRFMFEAENLISRITSKEKYSLILMEITKFKVINEVYGFEKANKILKDIYEIISAKLPKNTVLTRSFAATYLFFIKYENESEINALVDKIYNEIENYNKDSMKNYDIDSTKSPVKLVPLFGVYLVEDKKVPINIMCDRVGLAKRTIMEDINKYISYYDDNLRKQLLNEKNVEDEMHNALSSGQFVMYLQPKYDMKSLSVVGSEALARWIHPTKGFIPPSEFIPLFEKNGFVLNLDKYIWIQACKEIRYWINKGYEPVPISVNVSRLHLNNDYFIKDLINLVKEYNIPPSLIELELTETVGFEDFDKFLKVIKELKSNGFSIAMDDFGAGYSSLNMLRQIPCDILKLDRGFINDSTTTERGKIVVQHILSMAKNLSLKTVSEGIETLDQAKFLTDAGCDIAQGFLYAKPMSVKDFEQVAFMQKTIFIEGLTIS